MDLMSLFDKDKTFERVKVKPPRSNISYHEANETSDFSSVSVPTTRLFMSGTDYVKKYVEQENQRALEAAKLPINETDGQSIDEMSIGTVPTVNPDNQELTKLYDTFDFEYRLQDNLPIVQSKDEIISTIQTHSVTVIEGVTGCGKSTQVPQFILDNCYKQRKHCNIIVTQPRRIAALSIANRVSKERNWPLGTLVGVQVGMYRQIGPDTRLTYCTTGVLLRKLVSQKNMQEFTHVILDEVHERDQEMDFLLLVIRKLLRSNSRAVKVILMSATFNVDKFSEYFAIPTETGFVPAPIISAPKKRNYKVHIHYLCQLNQLGGIPDISYGEPRVSEEMMKFCIKLINVFDDIDKKSEYDAEDLVEYGEDRPLHATLIFLPGIGEIEEMHNFMTAAAAENDSSKWDIVILHSSITSDEQNKIFEKPPKGSRRIILSTNLAESSITIDDIKYVIDFCLTKQLITDPSTNFQCLELTWASKANCEQRAGRAGRVMDGRVYRLVPRQFYEKLPNEGDPEIKRAPLENLVLQTKLLDMGEPQAVLALAIDPPDLTNLESTILLLKESGGLLDKPDIINPLDGDLTDLGRIMAALPIDIHLSKLIALGHVFDVLKDTIIMAAAMALKSMFNNPFMKRMEAYMAKVIWADGSASDCLAYLNAYRTWQKAICSALFKKKSKQESSWASRQFIQIKVMHEVDYLIGELTQRLEKLGIKETMGEDKVRIDEVDRNFILKLIIAGAFYPNYFVRNRSIAQDDTYNTKALNGLDPTRTVFLTGWKFDHPGRIYAKRIQEIFKDVLPNSYERALVEFDGSSRVYVMFSEDKVYGNDKRNQIDIPGKVSLSVYKALKMRKLRAEINIPVLDVRSAKQLTERLNLPVATTYAFYSNKNFEAMKATMPKTLPILPSLETSAVPIDIVYFKHPNKFYARINDQDIKMKYDYIRSFLNDKKNITLTPVNDPPKIGSVVAAPLPQREIATLQENEKIARVVIEGYEKSDIAMVFYIDFGYRAEVKIQDMKTIKPNHEAHYTPALAFKCTLSHVEPSQKKDPRGLWTRAACDAFKGYVNRANRVFGDIYSVVDSVVALKVTCVCELGEVVLNDMLVKEELAEEVEEHYLSNYNNKLRQQCQEYSKEHRDYLEFLQYDKNFMIDAYPEPPPISECRSNMVLRGPNSPLEMNLSSLSINTSNTTVNIENNSVNSIILESDLDDRHERLLVSSIVSQSPRGNHLTLRNTTLLPNIRGLTALICLIFAPKIELRRSSNGGYYVGALCGLGYDPRTGSPLLPEHDLEVYFDIEIETKELLIVNKLRHYMNMGICVKKDDIDDLNKDALQCQRRVHDNLRLLLEQQMKPITPEHILNFGRWQLYDDSFFMHPTKATVKADSIFPLHSALVLEELDEDYEEMFQHLRELRSLSISDPKLSENIQIYCKLCGEEIFGRESLRIHLFMNPHKEKEKSLNIKVR